MKDLIGKLVSFKYRDRKEIITGFLLDYNNTWTLIKYNPVDYIIDGFMLLKTDKILKYKRDDYEEFHEKVLFAKNLKPEKEDIIPITNIFETLKLITEKFGAFKIELKDDKACYIGKFEQNTKENIVIREIDTKANWVETEKYKLRSIRTIEFNIDYINSLLLYNKCIENQ
jgi:hypothetical protein